MNRCPITYELSGDSKYSQKGISLLSKSLKHLKDFPFTAKEQVMMAVQMESKLSIQGVQPKLSAKLNVKNESFEIVAKEGKYIIKPPHHLYEEIPQNEDLTMRLATIFGIEVPLHGLIYNIDDTLSYFIKRFDRERNHKFATEDFSQLLGYSRETKYESSMEQAISVIEKHCTFPAIEKLKLFRLVIFNFITGNDDMHLKNFTLITREGKVELSPAYDLLNTTIIMKTKEEIALPIRGKKSKLNYQDLIEYFGIERSGLTKASLNDVLLKFEEAITKSDELIENSFLSKKYQDLYKELMKERWSKLTSKR